MAQSLTTRAFARMTSKGNLSPCLKRPCSTLQRLAHRCIHLFRALTFFCTTEGSRHLMNSRVSPQEGTLQQGTFEEGTLQEGTLQEGTLQESTVLEGILEEDSLLERTLREGTLQEGTLLEGTLLEGTLLEGTLLEDLRGLCWRYPPGGRPPGG